MLTEELGHHLDGWLHDRDTPGNEGELFAALLIRSGTLSASERQRLLVEEDHGRLRWARQTLAVELVAMARITSFSAVPQPSRPALWVWTASLVSTPARIAWCSPARPLTP
ncbi:MAG: hypothetical protein VKO39_06955 [Cyanobacteriota bacterium]|nr:hypothetical protein [Cyanobacteriota bacterium]